MWVCLAFPPYLAWTEQRWSFSTEGKKKKRNTAGGEVELSKRQNHPSHDQPQTFAAVTLVICALTVGNMAGQLPLGQMTFHFSVMAAFRVLSLSLASASSSASSHSSKTCQRGELLTRSVGVALSVVGWPAQDVPRLHPGCHLGQAPASHDP